MARGVYWQASTGWRCLYTERNPGPRETGKITGLSSAPRTCFDCNVLCFLLVLSDPPPATASTITSTISTTMPSMESPPPVPIKLSCTETMLCCGGVDSQQHCGCSPPEIQSPYSSTTTQPHTRTCTHVHAPPISSSVLCLHSWLAFTHL